MNRTRCPWCGKIIDKEKDKAEWKDYTGKSSVPRMLHRARCSHCKNKYGQLPFLPLLTPLLFLNMVLIVLALVLRFYPLLIIPVASIFFAHLAPYSKLDEDCRTVELREELVCDLEIVESYGKIKPYEIYFLEDNFDSFEPFVLASPIQIDRVLKKEGVVLGSFLYMSEKNYNYIDSDSCNLYDTDMALVAKVKIK